MRRKSQIREDEDATGMAGWMYSDLLLGLMVVFLATISFIPGSNTGLNAPDPKVAYSYARVHPVDFTGTYGSLNQDAVLADISAWKLEQGLAPTAYITKAQFVGTYDPTTEQNGDGVDRALTMSNGINAANGDLLRLATSSVRAVPSSEAATVTVKFTFASEVQVLAAP